MKRTGKYFKHYKFHHMQEEQLKYNLFIVLTLADETDATTQFLLHLMLIPPSLIDSVLLAVVHAQSLLYEGQAA